VRGYRRCLFGFIGAFTGRIHEYHPHRGSQSKKLNLAKGAQGKGDRASEIYE